MPYTYKLSSSNLGQLSPLAGYMLLMGWEVNAAGIAQRRLGGGNHGFLVAAINCESDQQTIIPAQRSNPGWGAMTLRMVESGTDLNVGGINYCGGTSGQFAGEVGVDLFIFSFNSIQAQPWRETTDPKWQRGFPITGTGKNNLSNHFSYTNPGVPQAPAAGAAVQPNIHIYHPRRFEDGTGVYAAALQRGFTDTTVHDLTAAQGAPVGWALSGTGFAQPCTPAAGTDGHFWMVQQGCLKSIGWWDFDDLSEVITQQNAQNFAKLRKLIYERVGNYGPLPRHAENVDRHDAHNVVISDDPSVETLYVKL